jgi:tetratricopeptide (TPR) repeat protein
MHFRFLTVAAVAAGFATAFAQTTARDQLAHGHAAWAQRLSKTAIAAFEAAMRDPAEAAEAHEALGRIYMFKGWQQEGVFPGWHDEPSYRTRAIGELKEALAADPNRTSAQEALRMTEGFATAEKVDTAPPPAEIKALDARIESYRNAADVPVGDIIAAIEARTKAQADPAPYFTGAQILIDRGEYDRAIALADQGARASDRFIDENLSAYQMSGKSQGSYARGQAQALDLAGWALFLKKDYTGASAKLDDAEKLFQGQDFTNQFHLGELARATDRPERARECYLNALSLAGGSAPLRQRATKALTAVGVPTTASNAGFDAWLESELARRRDARRVAALKSLVDRRLPKLPLRSIDGRPYDAASLQGKVLLLNFFASW